MKDTIKREDLITLINEMRVAYTRYAKTNASIGDYGKALEYDSADVILGTLWRFIASDSVNDMIIEYRKENDQFRGK